MYPYLKLIERKSKLWIFVTDYSFIANLLKNAHNYRNYANRDVMYYSISHNISHKLIAHFIQISDIYGFLWLT